MSGGEQDQAPQGGEGSPLLRIAEGLADARARLTLLEASTLARGLAEDTFRGRTEEHLDSQDDALTEMRRKLDDLLAQQQREAQQRGRITAEQARARALAAQGHRETITRISESAVSMGLALAATLLGLLAASWSPRERGAIFAGTLVVVVLILAVQWWSSRSPHQG